MSSHPYPTVGSILGVGLLSGVLLWGGQSLPVSYASNTPSQTIASAAIVPPATGFTDVAKRVTPAVVNISTVMMENVTDGSSVPDELRERMEEFFGTPFGPRGRRPGDSSDHRAPRRGQGSGVVISSDGYIVTNHHVIAQAREVNVTLPDKREFKGKIIGVDPKSDLAVIKINAGHLPTVSWGDASNLQVGEYVLAVGNPFGLNSTVTLGIVSAVGRGQMGITQYEDFIQTDAAINPGNSGGALVNTKGELVGINTAIFSQTGGYQGVGFAVSTTMAKPIYESLIKSGKVVRGYLGVGLQGLNQDLAMAFGLKDAKGVLISDVKAGSPADQAGLKQGDVIVRYQGTTVEDGVALQRLVTRTTVGARVTLNVVRDGNERELTVRVGEQPDESKIAKAQDGDSQDALSGLVVEELDQDRARQVGFQGVQGVLVTRVDPDSGAERAGLSAGDVIQEMNRRPIKSVKDFEKASSDLKKGAHILILINRRGNSLFVSVKV
ncbi:MAG: Do family serine endopeptidase [Nitrospira sp.]|nr:Do family serine endopeptidase [Nitrospira sp.]MDH4303639.1 Do family serine endopeptidase [Nitrospira sp.]MDH5192822.1 Do family serine endopeptidase [Nitrospira sp.]